MKTKEKESEREKESEQNRQRRESGKHHENPKKRLVRRDNHQRQREQTGGAGHVESGG